MKRSRKERINVFVDVIGWYGVIAILIAYALLSFDLIKSSSLIYQSLNLTGALGIVYEAFRKKDYEPTFLNIIWAIIALIAIIRLFI